MSPQIPALIVPIRVDEDGVWRVGTSRVPVETIIFYFDQGATPEEIVQNFSTLALTDVYEIIAYYLRHTSDVKRYIAERHTFAQAVRLENERRFPSAGFRERLLARQKAAASQTT